jgi:hypothetical protein
VSGAGWAEAASNRHPAPHVGVITVARALLNPFPMRVKITTAALLTALAAVGCKKKDQTPDPAEVSETAPQADVRVDRIRQQIAADESLSTAARAQIDVLVGEDGQIHLTGTVPSDDDRMKLEAIATGVAGESVVNEIVVVASAQPPMTPVPGPAGEPAPMTPPQPGPIPPTTEPSPVNPNGPRIP